jgi:hypothetical protein
MTTQEMTRQELDDAVFSAMQEALSNAPIGISARAKVNMASELTAEAMRLLDMHAKVSAPPKAKVKAKRKPRTPKATKDERTAPLPHIPPAAQTTFGTAQ